MEIPNGGPAFPRPSSTDEHDSPCNVYQDQLGMSLRDWFAGMALSGMVSGGWIPNSETQCAHRLYVIADAMLRAREARND